MNQSRGRKRPMKCCCRKRNPPKPSCQKLSGNGCRTDRDCGKGGMCKYYIDFGIDEYGRSLQVANCCCKKYPNTDLKICK